MFIFQYNDSDNGRFKVLRGSKNVFDLNRVVEIDGKDEMEFYEEDYCNQYRGTDGYLFPPFMNKNDSVWVNERSVCLSLAIHPIKSSRFNGITTYTYSTDFGDIANDENLQCYCRAADHCPPKGTFDLFNCVGVPILISLPHFYLTDPKLLNDIGSGLKPDPKLHMIYVKFETVSYIVLEFSQDFKFFSKNRYLKLIN